MAAGVEPPVKQVGDGKGRRGEDPERSFQWYTPKKRRATLYEDVTVDTQPSIHRHIDREWPVHFEDGRGLWWRFVVFAGFQECEQVRNFLE